MFLDLFLCKTAIFHGGPTLPQGDHNLNIIEFTLPDEDFTQASIFLTNGFERFFSYINIPQKIQLPFDTNPWESYLKHTKSLIYLLSEDASKQDSPCLRKWFLKGYFY